MPYIELRLFSGFYPRPMDNDSESNSPKAPPQSEDAASNSSSFLSELKRRKVMRVAITYAVVAWLIMQVAGLTFEGFGIPEWAFRFVVLMLVVFFPVAIVLAWAFELTPDGVKTARVARDERGTAPASVEEQRRRNLKAIGFAAALPTLIFGVLALFFFFRSGPSEDAGATPEKSIAVLPLANMSPDPENAFFADGVHEDILTNLTKVQELLVIGRTSTLQYRDTTKTLQAIGEELGVRYLVEGSVRRASNQVLVTVQLIDSQSGGHLWAENYNRPLDDIFAIQAEVAKAIAGQLHAVISPKALELIERRPTANQEAYDLYTKYRHMIDTQNGNYDDKAAVLEKAVALDPQFTEAWAYLAAEYITWWAITADRNDPELVAKAHVALSKAKSLEPNSAYVLLAKSFVEMQENKDYEAAIQLILEALTVDPSLDNGHLLLGTRYASLGRFAEAQYYTEKFAVTEPLNQKLDDRLYRIYYQSKQWDKCLSLIEKHVNGNNDSDAWERRLADLNYTRSGDRQAYLDDLQALPDFQENSNLMAWHAIVSRDYPTAQERFRKRVNVRRIFSRSMIRHFLSFVTGEEVPRTVMQSHQDFLKSLPDPEPKNLSNLAILYGLDGDREAMEQAISKARALSGIPYYSYLEGLEVEIEIATAYLILGDQGKAIETLEAASKMDGPVALARELDLWFIFDRLRGNPRFDVLLN